jgi:hypothetical protein
MHPSSVTLRPKVRSPVVIRIFQKKPDVEESSRVIGGHPETLLWKFNAEKSSKTREI